VRDRLDDDGVEHGATLENDGRVREAREKPAHIGLDRAEPCCHAPSRRELHECGQCFDREEDRRDASDEDAPRRHAGARGPRDADLEDGRGQKRDRRDEGRDPLRVRRVVGVRQDARQEASGREQEEQNVRGPPPRGGEAEPKKREGANGGRHDGTPGRVPEVRVPRSQEDARVVERTRGEQDGETEHSRGARHVRDPGGRREMDIAQVASEPGGPGDEGPGEGREGERARRRRGEDEPVRPHPPPGEKREYGEGRRDGPGRGVRVERQADARSRECREAEALGPQGADCRRGGEKNQREEERGGPGPAREKERPPEEGPEKGCRSGGPRAKGLPRGPPESQDREAARQRRDREETRLAAPQDREDAADERDVEV
jgi:hypothetical protein